VLAQSARTSSGGVNSGRPTRQKNHSPETGSRICIESRSSSVTLASRQVRMLDSLKSPITTPAACRTCVACARLAAVRTR
jgi:hypothetical protein